MANRIAAGWIAAGAVGGLIAAIVSYFWRASGIDGALGTLIVIVSSAVLLLLGVVLAFVDRPAHWLRVLLVALTAIDVVGTAVAAYFLHAWVLLAFMLLAAIGWVVLVWAPGPMNATRGATV